MAGRERWALSEGCLWAVKQERGLMGFPRIGEFLVVPAAFVICVCVFFFSPLRSAQLYQPRFGKSRL